MGCSAGSLRSPSGRPSSSVCFACVEIKLGLSVLALSTSDVQHLGVCIRCVSAALSLGHVWSSPMALV